VEKNTHPIDFEHKRQAPILLMEKEFISGIHADVTYSKVTGNVYKTVGKNIAPLQASPNKEVITDHLIMWGADNLLPQQILKQIRKNTIVGPTLQKKAEIAYDQIIYGFDEVDEAGNLHFKTVIDPKVEEFFTRSKIQRYLIEALRNFYYFYMPIPRIILKADRSEVFSLTCYKTAHFRFGKQDNSGLIKNGYLSSDWATIAQISDKRIRKAELIDIYQDVDFYKSESNETDFVYPVAYSTEDEYFYPVADWHALLKSGWLDVAQSIPVWKKKMFQNQITMKYLIQIPSWWWEWKYKGFEEMTDQERKTIRDGEMDEFERKMTGEDAAGNSLMVTYVSDPKFNKEYSGWKIEAIDNKIKDGLYVEDSNEAASHLLYALGVDPTLIGSMPGSKMGAGSGSDKRVAFNIYVDTVKAHQDLVLEPLVWIGQYNGWPNYKFRFKNSLEANGVRPQHQSKEALNEPQQQAS
jgi:hypothetical protein